jgi:hypothetical protein
MRLLIAGSKDFGDYNMFSRMMLEIIAKWQYDNALPLSKLDMVCDSKDSICKMVSQFCVENKIRFKVYPSEWRKYLFEYVEETKECSLIVFRTKISKDTDGIIKSCEKEDIPSIIFTIDRGEKKDD